MTPLASATIRALQEKADTLRDNIAGGQCGDFVEYKGMVNKRKGYLDAIEVVREKDKALEDEDE